MIDAQTNYLFSGRLIFYIFEEVTFAGLFSRQHRDVWISLEVVIGNHTTLLMIQKEGQCLLMANPDV